MRCIYLLCIVAASLMAACNGNKATEASKLPGTWSEIETKAKGSSITMMMFQGDKKVNRYMNEYVVPQIKKLYNIQLQIVPGQGKEVVGNLMSEMEAGKKVSEIDVCWINGETFFQLRQIDALFGPYSGLLPNSKYVDSLNPTIKYDFQQQVNGYETPWGQSLFYLIYDSARLLNAPVSMANFETYFKQRPGRFTLATDFSGMTLLKTWLVELAGGMNELDGPFNEAKYNKYSAQLWQWLNTNKQYFWKKGETFPSSNTTVSQMFSTGELDFTCSFNDAEIDNKVGEGVYPTTAKALILAPGTIQNTHYVGISANSGKKEAAMVLCNFLLSPQAQARKSDITYWGSGTVLDLQSLPPADRALFDSLPKRVYGLQNSQLKDRAIKELAPEYMLRVFDDFRSKVING